MDKRRNVCIFYWKEDVKNIEEQLIPDPNCDLFLKVGTAPI